MMLARKGHCTNFGLCGKADKRKRLKIIKGKNLVCPECAQPLDTSEPLWGFPWRVVTFTMAIVLIATAAEVYRLDPNLDGNGRVGPAKELGRVILRLRDARRVGSALASSLGETFRKLRGDSAGKGVSADQEAAVRVQGILREESADEKRKQ